MAENTKTPLLGAPFDQGVRQQIEVRKKYRSKDRKTDADMAEQYSKTAFIKVSSGVIIDGDSDIARNNVLQGGVLSLQGNQREGINYTDNTISTYTFSEAHGYRPMPGIKDIMIQSQNTEGTVRKTDLGFTVNSLEQLEVMERLYLRPGYSVLIEFGHSIYRDNDENLITDIPTVSEFLNDTTTSAATVEAKINELREQSDYNYDAIFGVCMNFQYAYNDQGGYDCTMYVMSKGTLLESIKSIVQGKAEEAPNLSGDASGATGVLSGLASKLSEKATSDNLSPAAEIFSKMYSIAGSQENSLDLLQSAYPTFGFESGDRPLYLHNVNSKEKKKKMVYIKFSTLMKILNNTLNLVVDGKENFFTLSSSPLVDSRYVTYDNHFSSNPGIALLPKKPNDQTLWFGRGATEIFGAANSDRINNIMINVVYLNDLLSSLSKENDEDTSLVDFIMTVCKDVGRVLGGYNKFDLHYVEEDNTFYIVDRMMTPIGGAPRQNIIPCVGNESLVSSLTVTSKISNEIASMIAIGAAASGENLGQSAGVMLNYNTGLVDKFKADLSQAASKKDDIENTDNETYADQLESIREVVRKFVVQRQFKRSECEDLAKIHAAIMASDMAKSSNPQQGTLPFECGFEIDGIGGIRIGQAFKLQAGILPSYVQDKAGFLVKSLNHNVTGNKWTTEISAYMFMLESDPSKSQKTFGEADLSVSDIEKITNFNGKDA